jgi:CheY-like chemotaxis protein
MRRDVRRFHRRLSVMSILIAEDNVAQRRYLRELLEREFAAHAPVVEAADGEEALALAL